VAWLILWKLEVPWVGEAALLPRPLKLIPFLPSGDAGASQPLEVLANVALFLPFGVYLALLAPAWHWWSSTIIFAAASAILETAQHLMSTGSFDTSDILANTAGGLVGLGILALIRRRLGDRTESVMTRLLLVLSVAAWIAITLFVISPLHYGPQRDVILPSPTAT
jgi:glycopeptide antibiotics resistance protein